MWKKSTLTCKIEEVSSIVVWMFEDNILPIAKCLRNSCNLNPDYVGKYTFTYNLNQGVYNLTILNLTKVDIRTKFVCSNGYDSVSTMVSFGEYKAMLFEDKENEEITAASGCTFPDTNVKIKWMKINAADNQESEFNPQLIHMKTKVCPNVFACNTNQQIQHLIVISAKSYDTGKYYLKITVAYANVIINSNISTLKYNVEEKDLDLYLKEHDFNNGKDSDDRKSDNTALLPLLVVISCLLLVIVVVVGGVGVIIKKNRCNSSNQTIQSRAVYQSRSRTTDDEESNVFIEIENPGSTEA